MSTVEKITRTINDPAASDLLRFICAKSLARDPVDAVNDLEYAAALFREHLEDTQMTTNKPEPMLWLSDARGIYIPRDFATGFADRDKTVSGVDDETWTILEEGPDHEWYWEAWEDVCNDATVTDEHGNKFTVYQEGDCWLIPVGMEWDDQKEWYVWP